MITNKTELIAAIAEQAGISKKEATVALDVVVNSIMETVAAGESLTLTNFGTFSLGQRSERSGVNPQTKEKIVIPATSVPKFKPGKGFKELVSAK